MAPLRPPSRITPALKRLLPREVKVRRLPTGIGRGLRLEIDFRHQTQLYLGLYEIELNRHLRRLCRPGYASFDVGGAHGYDALVLAKLSGARVVSFERESRLVEEIGRSLAANPSVAPLVSVRQATVGARTDQAAGTLSLDDAAEELGLWPQFVKVDIEGAEADALAGAERILERRPNLLVETHGPEPERRCMEQLIARGYSPVLVNRRSWLPEHRPLEHNRWIVAQG